eukprot:scaffold292729_cov27-Tisochrysis_lutea.AAC.2
MHQGGSWAAWAFESLWVTDAEIDTRHSTFFPDTVHERKRRRHLCGKAHPAILSPGRPSLARYPPSHSAAAGSVPLAGAALPRHRLAAQFHAPALPAGDVAAARSGLPETADAHIGCGRWMGGGRLIQTSRARQDLTARVVGIPRGHMTA